MKEIFSGKSLSIGDGSLYGTFHSELPDILKYHFIYLSAFFLKHQMVLHRLSIFSLKAVMYVYINIYLFIYSFIYVFVYLFIYLFIFLLITHTHIYIYIHTYIFIYHIYIYIYILAFSVVAMNGS